jgi:hypothetical protein
MMADGVSTAKELANGSFDHALENAIEFGMIEGAKAERARIASILRCAEAQTCVGTAILLAIHESAMTLQHVRDILQHVPAIDASTANVVDVRARRAALRLIDKTR